MRLARAIAALLTLALVAPSGAGAATPAVILGATTPRAFSPNGDGVNDVLHLSLTMAAAGSLVVTVHSFEGSTVATLRDEPAEAGVSALLWDGEDLPDGPYTVVAASGDATASLHVAIWRTMPSAGRPGRIVVALDPGHGGTDFGTSAWMADGRRLFEKDANLDTALKTGAMLDAAGYIVRYTRTSDVNRSLAQRTAFANAVHADVLVGMHYNWIGNSAGQTAVYYCGLGCYGADSSRALAQAVLTAHQARLAPFETDSYHLTPNPVSGWTAIDDYTRWFGHSDCTGTVGCHFGLLGPYSATVRPTAATMPAVLMESLAFSSPDEVGLIGDPAVRTQIAAAYADGIAGFFATRATWVRQERAATLPTLRRYHAASVRIRVVNTGSGTIPAGSVVVVGDRSRTNANDPGTTKGRTIGTRTLTSPLAPGAAVLVSVRVVPKVGGRRTWKVDFVVAGIRLSARRVPALLINAYVR
jgi:N-acetylmuramoyl-L-alanine amidase